VEINMKRKHESLLTDSIRKTLMINSIDEVIDMDYPDSRMDFDREEIMRAVHHGRTSVRIASGRFYTNNEFEEWRKRGIALPL